MYKRRRRYMWLDANVRDVQLSVHALRRNSFLTALCSTPRQAVAREAPDISQPLLDAIEYLFHGQ